MIDRYSSTGEKVSCAVWLVVGLVVAGFIAYKITQYPNEALLCAEMLGALWGCACVWYGLVLAFRSENKRVKSLVTGVMVVCYLALGFFGLAFLGLGLRNLYRHEFPYFVVALACLSLAITEFIATFETKQSERDWAKQKTRQFEYDIRQLREEKERLREENEDLRGSQRADYSGERAGNFDCLVTEHVRREMEKLEKEKKRPEEMTREELLEDSQSLRDEDERLNWLLEEEWRSQDEEREAP